MTRHPGRAAEPAASHMVAQYHAVTTHLALQIIVQRFARAAARSLGAGTLSRHVWRLVVQRSAQPAMGLAYLVSLRVQIYE